MFIVPTASVTERAGVAMNVMPKVVVHAPEVVHDGQRGRTRAGD
jgi:hypothetical protein